MDFSPHTVTEMLNLTKAQFEEAMNVKLSEADVVEERGCAFYGYAVKARDKREIENAYRELKIWHPEADHITLAVHFGHYQSCDDGEAKLGLKLQKVLEEREEQQNVAVFVVREYGGTRLGPKRFHIAMNVTREALNKL